MNNTGFATESEFAKAKRLACRAAERETQASNDWHDGKITEAEMEVVHAECAVVVLAYNKLRWAGVTS